jgi:hypothetical protein
VTRHLLAFAALLVNLWLGGDLVASLAGGLARGAFEVALIFAYAWFVFGIRVPPVWRRRGDSRPPGER